MSEYRVEPCTELHYPGLQELYRSAYGAEMDIKSLRKKYDTGALGGETISYVVIYEPENKLVSHFGATPVIVKINGDHIPAAQSIDAATDPAHRNKGLFKLLATHVHEVCRQKGIKIVFSQPNEASYHAFVKSFHFEHIDNIVRWDLKHSVKTIPLFRLFHKNSITRPLFFSYARLILKPFLVQQPSSFDCPLPEWKGRIFRNKAYLDYKASGDKFFLRINEAVFWIKLTDVFWIGDINDYNRVDEKVLARLKRIAFLAGFNTISFHLNEKTKTPLFLKNFRKYKTEPSCFLYLDEKYRGENILLTGADFDTW